MKEISQEQALEIKKSRDKYKRLYEKSEQERLRIASDLRGSEQMLKEAQRRLSHYEGIMQFVAEELSNKFGLLLRKEAESDYVRY